MKIVKASTKFMGEGGLVGIDVLRAIENAGRTCYKSENNITDDSSKQFVKGLIKRGHESVLEHISFTVKFIVDRGVSHELVRHRIASFSQESTRYCNYGTEGEITVIQPCFIEEGKCTLASYWYDACLEAERCYLKMLEIVYTPQEARSVLPNSLKTEVVMTANLREWRHFFKLRAVGTSGRPHPQMLEVTVPLLKEVQQLIPVVFDDLAPIGVPYES